MKTVSLICASALLALSAFTSAQAQNQTPNSVAQEMQKICAAPIMSRNIIRVINDIPVLKSNDITVVDWQNPNFLSIDKSAHILRCTMNVTFSNTKQAEFMAKIFPSPYHPNHMMILVREMNY